MGRSKIQFLLMAVVLAHFASRSWREGRRSMAIVWAAFSVVCVLSALLQLCALPSSF